MIMAQGSLIPTATDVITGPTPGIKGAMAAAVAMVTGTNIAAEPTVALRPTIPVTDIIVRSFGKAEVLQSARAGRRTGEVERLERHRGWEDHHPRHRSLHEGPGPQGEHQTQALILRGGASRRCPVAAEERPRLSAIQTGTLQLLGLLVRDGAPRASEFPLGAGTFSA